MRQDQILSVSQVNEYIRVKMDQDEFLSFICVRGEISNYKLYPSGHHYFSLKDNSGTLRCVMFKGSALRLRFCPENGMQVLAYGRISVFPRDGNYQLYCEQLTPEGAGDLFVAFEQLKNKLQAQGLFDLAHKKPMPVFPKTVAIITSSAGAAIHDMLRIIAKRFPLAKVILLPVRVQGSEAPAEICGAIRYANHFSIADVIIIGRGGGSAEDLWAFNDEQLAHTIYDSHIPIISAVGHEPDVTISDFVADLRAATPSNAAELVVPDQTELRDRLNTLQGRLQQSMTGQLKMWKQHLERYSASAVMRSPVNYIHERRMVLDHQQAQLAAQMEKTLHTLRQRYVGLSSAIDAMSPLKVLSRGYSVTKSKDGILTNAVCVNVGDRITVKLHRGSLDAIVTEIRGEDCG